MLNSKANYLFMDTVRRVKEDGVDTVGEVRPVYSDGTPAHTKFITNVYEEYDLEKGQFPIMTFRKIAWKSAIKEILWIYQDQSNDLELLREKYNISWWDSWDIENGTIGQRYGATVRRYNLIDNLIAEIKNNPNSRRLVINLLQYQDMNETEGLYPCAMETHFSVRNGRLDMALIQRSSDYLVANHINKLQYVALQLMIAKATNLIPGKFSHYVQNCHIYDRHFVELEKIFEANQISDNFLNHYTQKWGEVEEADVLPKLVLDTDKTNFYDFTIDDFKMVNYNPTDVKVKFDLGI